eukprot:gene19078-22811_t
MERLQHTKSDTEVAKLLRSSDGAHLRLALLLLDHVEQGSASRFAPYLAALPPREELAGVGLFWSEKERSLLSDPALADKMASYKSVVERVFYEGIRPAAKAKGAEPPPLKDWQLAVAIVGSRQFGGGENAQLVPGLDLINHQNSEDGANTLAKKVTGREAKALGVPSGAYVLLPVEGRQIHAGAELKHSYRKDNRDGVLPADEMLQSYGFLPRDLEQSLGAHYFTSPADLAQAFEREGLLDAEPVVALRAWVDRAWRDHCILQGAKTGQRALSPRQSLAIQYRYGRRVLVASQYVHFLGSLMGSVDAVQPILQEAISGAQNVSADFKKDYLRQQNEMVARCAARA